MQVKYYLYIQTLCVVLLALLLSSCENGYTARLEFVYSNSTELDVRIDEYGSQQVKTLTPEQSDTLLVLLPRDGGTFQPRRVTPPIIQCAVYYGDFLCDSLDIGISVGNGEGILNVNNYEISQLGEYSYLYIYTFTEDDVLKADTCR